MAGVAMGYVSVRNKNQDPPDNRFELGQQTDKEGSHNLYCVIAITPYGTIPGKGQKGEAWYPYGGKEHYTSKFSYVCATKGYEVQTQKEEVPLSEAVTGHQYDNGTYYMVICNTGHGRIPGKYSKRFNCAYYSYGKKEHYSSDFEFVRVSPTLESGASESPSKGEKEEEPPLQGDPNNINSQVLKTHFGFIKFDGIESYLTLHSRHINEEVICPPLTKAATLGDTAIVRALVRYKETDLLIADKDGNTALHAAAYWDFYGIANALLESSKDNHHQIEKMLNKENFEKMSPVFLAASQYGEKTCEEMIKFDESLRTSIDTVIKQIIKSGERTRSKESHYTAFGEFASEEEEKLFLEVTKEKIHYHDIIKNEPYSAVNMIIQRTPEVMKLILDKCITNTRTTYINQPKMITVDFGALQSFKNFVQEQDDGGTGTPNSGEDKLKDGYTKVIQVEPMKKQASKSTGNTLGPCAVFDRYGPGFNPLEVIVNSNEDCEFLLDHPVVDILIQTKWKLYGRTYAWISFVFHLVFLAMLIAYQLMEKKNFDESDGEDSYKPLSTMILGGIILTLSLLRWFAQVVFYCTVGSVAGLKIFALRPKTVVDICFYSLTLVCSINCIITVTQSNIWLWRAGICAIIFGSIKLLMFFRLVNTFGIYVIMLFKIAFNFLWKVFPIFVFFILVIWTTLHFTSMHPEVIEVVNFQNLLRSLLREVTGIKLTEAAREDTISNIGIISIDSVAFIVNSLFILLAGPLAIQDVKKIHERSKNNIKACTIEYIYHAERFMTFLPALLRERFSDHIQRFRVVNLSELSEEALANLQEVLSPQYKDKKEIEKLKERFPEFLRSGVTINATHIEESQTGHTEGHKETLKLQLAPEQLQAECRK